MCWEKFVAIIIDWFCFLAFTCPGTLRYQACVPACTAQSCPNQDFESEPGQCSGLTEGCVCPEGTLLHRPYSALCIPPDMCGRAPPPTPLPPFPRNRTIEP